MYRLEIFTDKLLPIVLEIKVNNDGEAIRVSEDLMEISNRIQSIRIYKCNTDYYNVVNISRR